ncbi:MAG: hypothetical protein AAF098_12605 [Pseudomonadota bacterium]
MLRASFCVGVVVLFLSGTALSESPDSLSAREQLEGARFALDIEQAEVALARIDPTANPLLFADASLLLAELKRGDYERIKDDKSLRREIGKEIDQLAKAGLAALINAEPVSERYRLEADLYATMIRTKFRGMKLQPKLEKSLEIAIEIDEENTAAWVSMSRRPLFAKKSQGGDVPKALELLNRALAINPDYVPGLMFRGTALAKLGESEAAEEDWDKAIALNPNVAEARQSLLVIEMDDLGRSSNNPSTR